MAKEPIDEVNLLGAKGCKEILLPIEESVLANMIEDMLHALEEIRRSPYQGNDWVAQGRGRAIPTPTWGGGHLCALLQAWLLSVHAWFLP